MGLDPRTNCVLIIYEETAPLPVSADNPHEVTTIQQKRDATLCDCSDSTCICRFNVTQVLPILPLECSQLSKEGACGYCPICVLLRDIATTPALRSLTNIYCAGVIVIQRGYLVPDYCNPMFKCLFKHDSQRNVLDVEAMLWTKFGAFVKAHILEKILSMFHCGVRPLPRMIGPLPRDVPLLQVKKWKKTNTYKYSDRRIFPVDATTNTRQSHVSMSYGAHQKMFSLERHCCLTRSKSMVGSTWMFLSGRQSLDCNNAMLLSGNEHLPMSQASYDAQFEPQNVGEGSAISVGDGEIAVAFPMTAMLHSASGTALTLKESSYPVSLSMMHESVMLRICCDAVGTHKKWNQRSFLCFPPRIRSKVRELNTIEIAGTSHSVVVWPEMLFRINSRDMGFKFQRPRGGKVLCYNMMLPSFLCIFLEEHNVYAKEADALENDIISKYIAQEEWKTIQNIATKEKYLLVMMLGTQDALEMLLHARSGKEKKEAGEKQSVSVTRKRKHGATVPVDPIDPVVEYAEMGHSITSAHAVSFTLSCCFRPIYDNCYDVCLSLLAVVTGFSGWHNNDICSNIAKLVRFQELLDCDADTVLCDADDWHKIDSQVCAVLWCVWVLCCECKNQSSLKVKLGMKKR